MTGGRLSAIPALVVCIIVFWPIGFSEPARAEVSPDGSQVLIDDEFGGFKVLDLDDGTEILHQAGDYLCG